MHAEIISLTPGLNIGSATNTNLGGVGSELHLTSPGGLANFTPVLWTDASAAPGTYEAVFRFFDEDAAFGDSGNIRFVTQVVPEPGSLLLAGAVGIVAAYRRRTL